MTEDGIRRYGGQSYARGGSGMVGVSSVEKLSHGVEENTMKQQIDDRLAYLFGCEGSTSD